MSTLLGIFAKQPIAGTVKTRLAGAIGSDAAARLYAAFVDDLIVAHRETADARLLGFSPDSPDAREWANDVAGSAFQVWPQPAGHLGKRMHSFFADAFESGSTRAVLIGSDSPNLPVEYVDDAFAMLLDRDVVVGPAVDGGYYLIGQRTECRDLFSEVEWSSGRVLEQTLANVQSCNASLSLLPVWYDIDTIDDARMLHAHLRADEYCSDSSLLAVQNTRMLLDQVLEVPDIK